MECTPAPEASRRARRKLGLTCFAVVCATGLSGCAGLGIGEAGRAARAKQMMAERCKTAGEKIYKTVSDVEGIFLMKVRPEGINYGDQFKLDDPYGSDLGGDGYIGSFLTSNFREPKPEELEAERARSYRYVEAEDPVDGKRCRYTGRFEELWQTDKSYLKGYKKFMLDKAPAPGPKPRYGVTYEDISTRQEREHWIAGSSLKVLDLEKGEILAERIEYMVDLLQGDNGGGRSPWLMAASVACPAFPERPAFSGQGRQTSRFVLRVLIPSKGAKQ